MFDRLTFSAKNSFTGARWEAQRFEHPSVGTGEALLGLSNVGGLGSRVLREYGLSYEVLSAAMETIYPTGTQMVAMGSLPFSPNLKKVLDRSLEYADHRSQAYVDTGHLLCGITDQGMNNSVGFKLFSELSIDPADLYYEVHSHLNKKSEDSNGRGNSWVIPAKGLSLTTALEAGGFRVLDDNVYSRVEEEEERRRYLVGELSDPLTIKYDSSFPDQVVEALDLRVYVSRAGISFDESPSFADLCHESKGMMKGTLLAIKRWENID